MKKDQLKLKGFVWRAEQILLLKGVYIEKILDLFGKGGLVKKVENRKYGTSLQAPKVQLIEDFAVFCVSLAIFV